MRTGIQLLIAASLGVSTCGPLYKKVDEEEIILGPRYEVKTFYSVRIIPSIRANGFQRFWFVRDFKSI